MSIAKWNELVAVVNQTTTFGMDGVRDPDYPCEGFRAGTPRRNGDCETDGHYMCDECVERANPEP